MKNLVILEPLGVAEEKLLDLAKDMLGEQLAITYYDTRATSDAELIARGKDAEIIIISNQPLSAEVIRGFEKCENLAIAFTGFDHIAMDVCREKGITVTNASGYSNEAVTDLVFGMTISLLRMLRACDTTVRQGGTIKGLVGHELAGKKFGVVGTGAIGMQVIKVAQAFGCDVIAHSRTQKEIPGVTYADLATLMATCDVISVHTPMNDATKGIISKDMIALMKPTALLVNCGRGPLVDIEALAVALHEGKIGGAAIDVFYTEPPLPADHPLFSTPNTLLTPHVAYATIEAFEKRAVIVFDNILAYLAGAPTNVVK